MGGEALQSNHLRDLDPVYMVDCADQRSRSIVLDQELGVSEIPCSPDSLVVPRLHTIVPKLLPLASAVLRNLLNVLSGPIVANLSLSLPCRGVDYLDL